MDVLGREARSLPVIDELVMIVLVLHTMKKMLIFAIYLFIGFAKDFSNQYHLLEFVDHIGCVHRPLTGVSLHITTTYFANFYLLNAMCNYIYRKQIKRSNDHGLVLFVHNEKAERKRITSRLDAHIRKVQHSSRMFYQVQLQEKFLETLLCTRYQVDYLSFRQQVIEIRVGGKNNKLRTFLNEHQINRLEQEHLNHLLSDSKESIWPSNRTEHSRRAIISRLFWITVWQVLIFWSFGQITYTGGHHLLNQMRLKDKSSIHYYSKDRIGFSGAEKLEVCAGLVSMWEMIYMHYNPVINPMMGLADQGVHLAQIQRKFCNLIGQVSEYNGLQFDQRYQRKLGSRNKDELEKLRSFNEQSNELYIMFQFLVEEANSMLKDIEYHTVFYFFLQFYQTIALIVIGQAVHYNTIHLGSISGIITLNLSIYPCAIFNKRCADLTKLIHSFLMQVEQSERPIISEHGKFLWNRIVHNQQWISDMSACKLAGMLKLNFKTVLQLNFWIVSSSLLILSTLSQ